MIEISNNRYDGVIVDNKTLPEKKDEFKKEIICLLESLKNKKLIWIKIPIKQSEFIPILTDLDFEFHHCDENNLMLFKKLSNDAVVPVIKNYIVGVGAIVLNEGQLLVIKNRFSTDYKLPGGHIDRNESIVNAVKREVYEETGINIDFESIVNIGHFRNGQFGESNLYIVCTAKALSNDIKINDSTEIAEAIWMDPEHFLRSDDVNNYYKRVVEAAINNKELKLTEQHIMLRVPDGEVFF